MMNEKVMKWRSSPFHRRCIFCEYLKLEVIKCDPSISYYRCIAKDKYICDVLESKVFIIFLTKLSSKVFLAIKFLSLSYIKEPFSHI